MVYTIVTIVLGGVVLVAAVVTGMMYLSVQMMSREDLSLDPADEQEFADEYAAVAQYRQWADDQGFEWVGGYVMTAMARIFVAAWRHPTQPVFFCVYIAQNKINQDFVTIYDKTRGLTTGSTRDGLTLPHPPGAHMQVFENIPLNEQYARHLEAEVMLTEKLRYKMESLDEPFEVIVVDAIHRQMEYVKSIPLWPLRGVWWFFVTRNMEVNKPVTAQSVNSPG